MARPFAAWLVRHVCCRCSGLVRGIILTTNSGTLIGSLDHEIPPVRVALFAHALSRFRGSRGEFAVLSYNRS